MKKNFIIIFISLITLNAFTQQIVLSGYVSDKTTGEVLIGTTIFDLNSESGITTNQYGYYSISIEKFPTEIEVSFIGYQPQRITIDNSLETELNIKLTPQNHELNEVVVVGKSVDNPIKTNISNFNVLSPKDIEIAPIAFGETDVIKVLQLKAGVTTLGEGSSGMFVQGGNTDQNLILIDDAPVYNPSHLFGLVSVFNPDAIKNVEFYKGAIPAQFGGRLSAVINSQMNDGDKYTHRLSGGIGTLTARMAVNGPIKKDTASYLLAVRRSIRDLFQNPENEGVFYVPQFYDINAKVNWNINNNNRLFFSLYNGNDKIKSDNDYLNNWGNTTVTIRWNSILSHKLFMNLSTIYSNYNNNMNFVNKNKNYSWLTGVEDIFAKLNFTWHLSKSNKIKFGTESIYHKYKPGENGIPEQSMFRINALENSAYILNDYYITPWLGLNYGIRYALFQNTGKAEWYTYSEYIPTGSQTSNMGVYNSYHSIEPRITINLRPNLLQVLKLSYARTTQFSQVLQNSLFSYTSIQTWMPANKNIKPLFANIVSAGYFLQPSHGLSLSIEGYYKKMYNICDYIERAQLINYPYVESQIRTGNGNAYGITFQTKYIKTKIDIDASYTFSRVFYKIEDINHGNEYSALHDIPHDFKLTAIFKPIKRLGISAFFNIHSGFSLTLPVGYANNQYLYTSRNSGRFPVYHRLDLSFFWYQKEGNTRWKGTWSAGVYNAYNKFNPIGVNFSAGYNETVYVYTLYRMIPYISYKFNF
ncbi:MAG: carboxypeptidase-like regulatory domain-containing protein [Bacteroidales bacterium]|nr:carboxypeptidase-like regulatory domain-containing protein [Bacteroidales bacterium]